MEFFGFNLFFNLFGFLYLWNVIMWVLILLSSSVVGKGNLLLPTQLFFNGTFYTVRKYADRAPAGFRGSQHGFALVTVIIMPARAAESELVRFPYDVNF